MKIDIDYKFGGVVYLRNDPEQLEYLISRIMLDKGRISFEVLSPLGEYLEVAEFLVSKEKDTSKTLGIETKEED